MKQAHAVPHHSTGYGKEGARVWNYGRREREMIAGWPLYRRVAAVVVRIDQDSFRTERPIIPFIQSTPPNWQRGGEAYF